MAVIGGYVYRGTVFPPMAGHYFFADFSGSLWSLYPEEDGEFRLFPLLTDFAGNFSSFGESETGELYIADYLSGTIYRIESIPNVYLPAITRN